MNSTFPATPFPETSGKTLRNTDRLGVIASVLCAIHCAAAPLLLLAMPAFGQIWAHPASHWGMAIFVVPIAIVMTIYGFRKHGKKWVLASAGAGVLLVLFGAILPYLAMGQDTANGLSIPLPFSEPAAEAACVDPCCPSTTEAAGQTSFHIPPAALATTLGGIFLIITHVGNLRSCRSCCKACN